MIFFLAITSVSFIHIHDSQAVCFYPQLFQKQPPAISVIFICHLLQLRLAVPFLPGIPEKRRRLWKYGSFCHQSHEDPIMLLEILDKTLQ
jgi:hypothetical protein